MDVFSLSLHKTKGLSEFLTLILCSAKAANNEYNYGHCFKVTQKYGCCCTICATQEHNYS